MREHFLTEHAAEATGVPPSTIHYWTTGGVITASVEAASGRGSTCLYSLADLIAIRVARELREAGTGLETIRRVTNLLQYADPFKERRLLGVGRGIVCWLQKGVAPRLNRNRRTLLVVDYPGLAGAVIAAAQRAGSTSSGRPETTSAQANRSGLNC